MISSIVWVPAGVADPNPKRYEMSAKELEVLQLLEQQQQQQTTSVERKPRKGGLQVKMASAPSAAAADLPADLRMDEYSSDEEDEDAAVGRLLMGQESGGVIEEEEGGSEEEEDDDDDNAQEEDNSGMDDDEDEEEDDDLDDVPDTREFEPVDVEGLQSMGLNQTGNSAMHMEGLGEEDDDSEAENVQLSDDDAIVLVAKTEDVSRYLFRPSHE